ATGGDLPQTYYLRPRHKNEPAVKGSWGGVCVNWTAEKGCSLPESKRPFQCRMLVPNHENGKYNCKILGKDKASKQDCAAAWYKYQGIIQEAKEKYFMIVEQI
ncbi:hypothetical protein L0152_13910, partial [bacterium]|nr:hypothetical protein [bacterium]